MNESEEIRVMNIRRKAEEVNKDFLVNTPNIFMNILSVDAKIKMLNIHLLEFDKITKEMKSLVNDVNLQGISNHESVEITKLLFAASGSEHYSKLIKIILHILGETRK